jgi:ribosomal protein S18 acetylase RimI-like enzyme
MSTRIIKEPTLKNKQIQDILQLYTECNAYDYSKYVFDQNDDFKKEDDVNTFLLYDDKELVSLLTMFVPTDEEAEIIAMTRPSKRHNGYFNVLLKDAGEEIKRRNIKSILFVCDARSEDGNAVILQKGAVYEYSEYLMRFTGIVNKSCKNRENIQIAEAKKEDKNILTQINHDAFNMDYDVSSEIINEFFNSSRRNLYSIKLKNKILGMIGVYDEPSRKYIYGFCIDPEYQKQGIGKYVLQKIVDKLKTGKKEIVLEVQTNNRHALQVYESAGFSIEAEFKYSREIT